MRSSNQWGNYFLRTAKRLALASALVVCLSLSACGSKPEPALTDYIGMEAAKSAALEAQGITADQASFSSAELTDKDGSPCYHLVFTQEDTEHIYEIDAMTGVVLAEKHSEKPEETFVQTAEVSVLPAAAEESTEFSASAHESETFDMETQAKGSKVSPVQDAPKTLDGSGEQALSPTAPKAYSAAGASGDANPSAASSQGIDGDTALSIALSHAGLTAQDISYSEVKADIENGQRVFEVEFILPDRTEYDYEVRASDGAVISFDYDIKSPSRQAPAADTPVISESQARQSVLGKLPQAKESDISLHLEKDDGKWEYEGKVVYGGMKYEFKIDAYSGSILEWEGEQNH